MAMLTMDVSHLDTHLAGTVVISRRSNGTAVLVKIPSPSKCVSDYRSITYDPLVTTVSVYVAHINVPL